MVDQSIDFERVIKQLRYMEKFSKNLDKTHNKLLDNYYTKIAEARQ